MNNYELLREKYLALDKEVRPLIREKNQLQPDVNEKLTYPLFLKDWGYYEAEIRLMVFGQETNGWGKKTDSVYGERDNTTVDTLIENYTKFFNDGIPVNYNSPLWTVFKRFTATIREKYHGSQEEVQYLWNNLVKAGKQDIGFPDKYYNDIIKPYFNGLVLIEIELLEPDFIIFFTGPDYDFVLDDVFGKPEKCPVTGFTEKELCEVKLPCKNVKKSFRTYHPNFLYRNNSNRPYKEFLDTMVEEILKV